MQRSGQLTREMIQDIRNVKDKGPICRNNLTGKCFRGTSCKFIHFPWLLPRAPDGSEYCIADLLGEPCEREDTCGFYHFSTKKAPATKRLAPDGRQYCIDFQRGKCRKANCNYYHSPSPKSKTFSRRKPFRPVIPRFRSTIPRPTHSTNRSRTKPAFWSKRPTPLDIGETIWTFRQGQDTIPKPKDVFRPVITKRWDLKEDQRLMEAKRHHIERFMQRTEAGIESRTGAGVNAATQTEDFEPESESLFANSLFSSTHAQWCLCPQCI